MTICRVLNKIHVIKIAGETETDLYISYCEYIVVINVLLIKTKPSGRDYNASIPNLNSLRTFSQYGSGSDICMHYACSIIAALQRLTETIFL